jgi:putative ABC transport system permease protein
MVRNLFKVALRNLLKQRVYTAINVAGFTIGIASCMLILLYTNYELSYDTFFERKDRIFKLALERKYPENVTFFSSSPPSFAKVIKQDFPEVENTVVLGGPYENVIMNYKVNEKEVRSFEEDHVMSGDSTFFKFFSFQLLKGDPSTVLSLPTSIVLTESTAKRYFGSEDPIGKTLGGDFGDFTVTGVCADVPDNCHMKFDILFSVNRFGLLSRENYIRFFGYVYIELKPGADPAELEKKFPKMVDTYAAAQIQAQYNQSWEDYTKAGNGYRYFLQPLTSIHLDPINMDDPLTPSGSIYYVYILITVAIIILTIACINFMNLSTARSSERALEVGIRKTMGSQKSHLMVQFLLESVLLAAVATLLAVLLTEALLPGFRNLTQKNLLLNIDTTIAFGLVAFTFIVGILAGIYPSFVLSGFKPAQVLKGNFKGSAKGTWMRNSLVVVQFTISIILIVGTISVMEQLTYMRSKKLGFDKDNILIVDRAFALRDHSRTFANEVRKLPGVVAVGGSSNIMGVKGSYIGEQYQQEGSSEIFTAKGLIMDDYFPEAIGFEIVEGRFFTEATDDSLSLVLNEAAVRVLGIKNPVGSKLSRVETNRDGTQFRRTLTVVGVMKDFHFQPLRDEISPVVFRSADFFRQFGQAYMVIKVNGNLSETARQVENLWKDAVPGQPFKFSYFNENLEKEYAEESRSARLFSIFSGIAIFIACVGLFGLSAYTANLRTREIGIRKVMGSSVNEIVFLLARDFTKLVLISFVIAAPLAAWLMQQWLNNFAYRISLGIGTFALAAVAAFGIAWVTVSYQSIKAAVANPVKSLRND